jgi:folate-binding protein YgfZ
MNPIWRSFLESADGRFAADSNELSDFGDAAGELLAARDRTVLVPLTHLGQLQASGEDAKPFLHGQFTSDVNHLAEGKVQHSSWCSAKGRMQASFLIWRSGDDYRLLLAADLEAATHKRLQMFVLRSKVKIAAQGDEFAVIGIAGPQAAEALADAGLPCPDEAMALAEAAGVTVLRIEDKRFIVSANIEAAPVLWQKLSVKARPAGLPVWRWLDVQAAFPLVTAATKEEFVPQMADFDKIGGVSFHKGCYPGQEVVARTQYLGKVKRHLFRVNCAQPLQAGDVLYSPDNTDQSCGNVMSAAPSPAGGYEALAVIQSNFSDNVRLGSREGVPLQTAAVNP